MFHIGRAGQPGPREMKTPLKHDAIRHLLWTHCCIGLGCLSFHEAD